MIDGDPGNDEKKQTPPGDSKKERKKTPKELAAEADDLFWSLYQKGSKKHYAYLSKKLRLWVRLVPNMTKRDWNDLSGKKHEDFQNAE